MLTEISVGTVDNVSTQPGLTATYVLISDLEFGDVQITQFANITMKEPQASPKEKMQQE